MSIDLNTIIRRGDEHIETKVGNQTLMLSAAAGKYFAVESSGQRIWELLKQPSSVRSVVSELQREYDVSHDRCREEVIAFVSQLVSNGLEEIIPHDALDSHNP